MASIVTFKAVEGACGAAASAAAKAVDPVWTAVSRVFKSPFCNSVELRDHGVRLLTLAEEEVDPSTRIVAERLGLYCTRLAEDAPEDKQLYFDYAFARFIAEMRKNPRSRLVVGEAIGSGGNGVVTAVRYGTMVGIVQKTPLVAERDSLRGEAVRHHLVPPDKSSIVRGGIYFPYFVKKAIPSRLIYEAAKGDCMGFLKTVGFTRDAIQSRFSAHARGLAHLHKHGLAFLDYKLQNGLEMRDGRVVLSDFSSVRCVGEKPREYSAQYVSPELAFGEGADQKMDVFTFGSVLFHAISDTTLFTGENVFSLSVQVCAASQDDFAKKVTDLDGDEKVLERDPDGSARHLLSYLLRVNPSERPEMADVSKHPFLDPASGVTCDSWVETLIAKKREHSPAETLSLLSISPESTTPDKLA